MDRFHADLYALPPAWTVQDDPKGRINVDGQGFRIAELDAPVTGEIGFAFSVNQKELDQLGRWVDVATLSIKSLRADDLDPLTAMDRLRRLQLWWVPKLTSIAPLARMTQLDVLFLDDLKKVTDFGPLAALSKLRALNIESGMWNKQPCNGLEPLLNLQVSELRLANLAFAPGEVRSLAQIETLRDLWLSYNLPVDDYAWLHAKRPDLRCDAFQPYQKIAPFDGKDVMVIGKRKPMLNAQKDAKRLAKYVAAWDDLVAGFREG